ncbi:alpha-lytic protease prodomain-containing protein [Actinophytocola sp. KF-1]
MKRSTIARAAIAALAAAGIAAMAPGFATAAPLSAHAAQDLAGSLGDARTAGVYVDATGRTVVTVTDAAAAAAVRAAGATPRIVERSAAQLGRLMTTLDKGVAGTAWAVDPVSNQVVVSVASDVRGARLAALRSAAAGSDGAVRIERLRPDHRVDLGR